MNKIICLVAVFFISLVSPVMAVGPLGVPSPMDTEEGKWLKNKIHDTAEKYGNRFNSKILKKSAKVMGNAGWDKEKNERATEKYNQGIRYERDEYCMSHPEKCKMETF